MKTLYKGGIIFFIMIIMSACSTKNNKNKEASEISSESKINNETTIEIIEDTVVAETETEIEIENESASKVDLLKKLNLAYMGGLYARSTTNDMMVAFFKSTGSPIVVITEYGETYYGDYVTEEAELSDGTKYTKLTVGNLVYGYRFDDEWTGILVDQNGNKYEAKKLDESVAIDMLESTVVE